MVLRRSALFIAGAAAFAPAPRITPVRSSLRADLYEAPPAAAPLEAPAESDDEVEQNMLSDFASRMAARGTGSNVKDAAKEYVDSVRSNVQVEQSGPSYVYVAAQAALILLLLVGDVPFIGGAIETLLGPGLVVAGLGAIALGVLDLGAGNLTPFAAPVEDNELKTTGAFAYVRHPIYGGLLVAATGLGVAPRASSACSWCSCSTCCSTRRARTKRRSSSASTRPTGRTSRSRRGYSPRSTNWTKSWSDAFERGE